MPYYRFNDFDSVVGICHNGGAPEFAEKYASFILDNSITALALKTQIGGRPDSPDCPIVGRRRIVLYKDADIQAYQNAEWQKSRWKTGNEEQLLTGSFRLSDSAKSALRNIVDADFPAAEELYKSQLIASREFEISRPYVDDKVRYSEDYEELSDIVVELPINPALLEEGVAYRLMILNEDQLAVYLEYLPKFYFFRLDGSITQTFVPEAASIRVVQPRNGRYSIANSKRFSNYSDFLDDIHYDPVCMEVEICAPQICFEIAIPERYGENLPYFSIALSNKGKELLRRNAREYMPRHGLLWAYLPFNENTRDDFKGNVTADLYVLGSHIATFTFSMNRTTPGYYRATHLIPRR